MAVDAVKHRVVWANAAGARLLGGKTVSSVTGLDATENILLRQFMAMAGRLNEPGDSRSFTVNLAQRFRRVPTQAEAQLFVLGGRRYVLFGCDTKRPGDVSEDLIAGFDEDEAHLALVDASGALSRATPDFARTGLNEPDIARIAESLTAGAESYTERLATTHTGIWPVALGRLSGNPRLFLIFVSEELSGELPGSNRSTEPSGAQTGTGVTVERSARDAIAAIDESLGALVRQTVSGVDADADVKNRNVVVRKRQPLPAENPEQHDETTLDGNDPCRPLRFVWRTDAEGRIISVSAELAAAVGADTATIEGLRFEELETQLGVAGGKAIAQLLKSADTWSGRTVEWPVSGTDMLVPVDLAALPTYSRERSFSGFRGFGLVRLGEETEAPQPSPKEARPSAAKELTADERHALAEIATQLRSADEPEPPQHPVTAVPPENKVSPQSPVIRRRTAESPTAAFRATKRPLPALMPVRTLS
nr:hypothetical protein [Marinicella sp. W31]MDC2875806.1 hypothetical protein [Marinicella sp. W31]